MSTDIRVTNPYSGDLVGTTANMSEEAVECVLRRASAASRGWARTPTHERVAVLRRFSQQLEPHVEELAQLLSAENGKRISAARDEIRNAGRLFDAYATEALRIYGQNIPGEVQAGFENDLIVTTHEPYGVAVLVTPFNFPVSLFTHKTAPALATGNVVIIKPSQYTPLATMRMVELLHRAGVPEDVLQVATGEGRRVGEQLVTSPLVQLVSFTGSTAVGVNVAGSAAKHLARTKLELGGNDPLLVLPDADLDLAVSHAVSGRTLENGQCCTAAKRFLVHSDVADEFEGRLVAELGKLVVGDQLDEGTDIGPLIHDRAAAQAAGQVGRVIEQGARLALGTGRNDGALLAPQVLVNVTADADVARDDEIFAPVWPVIRFTDDQVAADIANSSVYGLHASVFSRDTGRALRMARELEAGLVAINGSGLYKPAAIAFGGYKMSGVGREGLTAMAQEFTQVKTIAMRNILQGPQ
ncbi:NAD-dependent succinate-semialdehyde dehydrogenase [Modestobacter lapidis]